MRSTSAIMNELVLMLTVIDEIYHDSGRNSSLASFMLHHVAATKAHLTVSCSGKPCSCWSVSGPDLMAKPGLTVSMGLPAQRGAAAVSLGITFCRLFKDFGNVLGILPSIFLFFRSYKIILKVFVIPLKKQVSIRSYNIHSC